MQLKDQTGKDSAKGLYFFKAEIGAQRWIEKVLVLH